MGNQKLKWTPEEEEALRAGVAKHGAGKWKNILVDSQFAQKLADRSNVDLKDKWRNMGANHWQGSGDNATTPKGRTKATSAVPHKNQTSSSSSSLKSKGNSNGKTCKSPQDAKITPNFGAMILEAVSVIKDHSGSDYSAIIRFIEKKYEVPPNFRRLLSSKLRRLVLQGALEKVQKRYKIKRAATGTKTPVAKQHDVQSRPAQASRPTVEDAAETAAQKIAEAENKSFLAAEAIKDSEWISRMAEDADAQLMHLNEIIQQWGTRNERRGHIL